MSGKARRARAGRFGRDGALKAAMTTSSPLGAPAAGLRGALLDGRLVSNLSTVSSTSLLSLQPPAGAGQGLRMNVDLLLRHSVLTLKLNNC